MDRNGGRPSDAGAEGARPEAAAPGPGGLPGPVANIGPRERARRARLGWTLLAAGAVAGVALVASGAGRWWRLTLFLPLWAGALGVFQARGKT